MPELVRLARHGSYASVRAGTFLGPARFADFRRAIEGARYDFGIKTNLAPLDKIPAILNRLRDANFGVEVDGPLHAVLLERTAQQFLDLKSAQDRIEAIDRELFEQTGKRLFPFQKTGCQWLSLKYGALLADDPGLGKTLETLVALPARAPVLVVGPAAAKGVWVGEVERWRPKIDVRMLTGRDSFRWPKPGQMLVLNYDILPEIHDTEGRWNKRPCDGFLPAPPALPCTGCKDELVFRNGSAMNVRSGHEPGCTGFMPPGDPEICPGCHPLLRELEEGTVLVADEAQALKNGRALRTLRFRALSKAVREKHGRCWLVTGTPMENDPSELWSVLEAAGLAAEAFGTFKQFVSLFKGTPKMIGYGQTERRAGYDWGDPDSEVTERLQRVSLRRRQEDVLTELPDLLWREVVVDIDPEAVRACDAFVEREGGMETIQKLLSQDKIPFDQMSKILTVLAMAKYKAALEIVKEHERRSEPLLVFSMHREPIDMLAKRKGWLRITGSEKGDVRREIQDRFQDPKNGIRGIACTIQAAGVALTLTRAAHELFIDRAWNPAMNLQAAKRAHRIGQRKSVVATYLRGNHVLDRRLQEVVTKKSRLFVASIDAAAVTDDAPPCAAEDFEDQIRQIQEDISCGRAIRRMADSPERLSVLEKLHTLRFARASDERLVRQLAEEAVHVGLSEKQWDLAVRVSDRGIEKMYVSSEKESISRDESGRDPENGATKAVSSPVPGKDGMVVVGGDPHLYGCAAVDPLIRGSAGPEETCTCGSVPSGQADKRTSGPADKRTNGSTDKRTHGSTEGIDMKKVKAIFGRIEGLTETEQDMLFELFEREKADVKAVQLLKKDIEALTEPERQTLMEMVREELGDEDEDEDDDDDDTGDDGEPEDDDDDDD